MKGIGLSIGLGAPFNSAPFHDDLDTYHMGLGDIRCDSIYIPSLTVYDETDIYYKYTTAITIDSQRDNKSVAIKDNFLWYSEDNSKTFRRGLYFANSDDIGMSYIFANGNILFAEKNKIYLSTDNLQTSNEITVRDTGGTPISTSNPGWYYRMAQPDNPVIIDGVEHLVWGSYTNLGGNSEVNVYHTKDNGATITMVYQFGQNPGYDSYGDAGNATICRHVHSINYNPNENIWWMQTGDDIQVSDEECHWVRGTYDGSNWTWTVMESGDDSSGYKTVAFYFDSENNAYWAADTATAGKTGIWKVPYSDIGDSGEYVRKIIFPKDHFSFTMNSEGEMITSPFSFDSLAPQFTFSKDFAETSTDIDETVLTNVTNPICLYRVWPKNTDGYFLMKAGFSDSNWGAKNSLLIKLK